MLCDCHQRLRLPQMSPEMNFVMKLQIAVVGLRGRHLYGRTHHSVLSATVQVAGPGGGRGGVQLQYKIPQLVRVAFEECPTEIAELGVKLASVGVWGRVCA